MFAPLADEPFRFAPELRFAFPYGDCLMVRGAQNLPFPPKKGLLGGLLCYRPGSASAGFG